MPRKSMLAAMDSRELSGWFAFDRVHGLPDPWYQTGILAAVSHNGMFTGPRKTPEDFMPRPVSRAPQSADEGLARMRMITAAMKAHS